MVQPEPMAKSSTACSQGVVGAVDRLSALPDELIHSVVIPPSPGSRANMSAVTAVEKPLVLCAPHRPRYAGLWDPHDERP